jgi:hypothetical protein
MNKPTKRTREYWDYYEIILYIEEKYEINTRNYAGKFATADFQDKPYLDFWHWILENDGSEVHNGSFFSLQIQQNRCDWDEESYPSWVREILALIDKEFGGDVDENGYLEMWVEW